MSRAEFLRGRAGIIREEGQRVLGWRAVPIEDTKC
jgi:hypothetical protein